MYVRCSKPYISSNHRFPFQDFQHVILSNKKIKSKSTGFPGGAVVTNPPANAGDTGSSPGLGRSHMPRSNQPREPQLLSLRSRACEPQLLKPTRLEPVLRNKRSHDNEKLAHHNEDPMQPKINK